MDDRWSQRLRDQSVRGQDVRAIRGQRRDRPGVVEEQQTVNYPGACAHQGGDWRVPGFEEEPHHPLLFGGQERVHF